ncbi:hypothetical protein BGX38DRAFT_1143023 [Terfezia claveryi]|nr:hypothetical protein BGX38DRAFT_1143023 [Terfezia claveryi]
MVSSSAPASPVSVRQLEHPQVNINTPGGHTFPLPDLPYQTSPSRGSDLPQATGVAVRGVSPDSGKSPKRSPISRSSSSRRKAFKSSIPGETLVTGMTRMRRALSTSGVHGGGGNGKMKLPHGGPTTIVPKGMASTGHLNLLRNESAVYDESDCACIDTDDERSLTCTRGSSPSGCCSVDQNLVGQRAAGDPKLTPNRKVAGRPAPAEVAGTSMSRWLTASAFTKLSWADQRGTTEKPRNRKASQSIAAATSWFRGRGMEKENLKARGKSLDLKRNKKRGGIVGKPEEEVEDTMAPQLVHQGSSLKVSQNDQLASQNDRLAARKSSLPETEHETQKNISQVEWEKIVPWERMGEGKYSRHVATKKLISHPQPQEKSREGRWIKAMNALNLDVRPSIHSKSCQSSGALSATSASLADSASGCQPSSSIRGDFQGSYKNPGHSLSQEWYSSSSDEAEDAKFDLNGLSPRPITGDEQLKKYQQLLKEQRWAEAKLGCELGAETGYSKYASEPPSGACNERI